MAAVQVPLAAQQFVEDAGLRVGGAQGAQDAVGGGGPPVDPALVLAQVRPGVAGVLRLRGVGAGGEAVDGQQDGGQCRVGDLPAVRVALADGRERAVDGGPDVAGVHVRGGLEDGDAPAVGALGDGPVERGGAPVTDGPGVHDEADLRGPDVLGDGRFQHRCEDQVRLVAADGFGEVGAGQGEFDRHAVPAVPQFGVHPLGETVERARDEQDVHVISQASGLGTVSYTHPPVTEAYGGVTRKWTPGAATWWTGAGGRRVLGRRAVGRFRESQAKGVGADPPR